MHIVDSLKEVVSDDPAIRAQKIISELVSPLASADQTIIHDLVSLIRALASNPTQSIDVNQIKETARLLIDELIKPIPHPNKQLADQLLEVVVSVAKKEQPKPAVVTESPKQQSSKQESMPDSVLKLLTGEIKELVRKHQALDMFTKEMDGKNQTKFSSVTEEVDSLKSHIQKVETKIDDIQKNLDKFLSLYEIVINQYNPFIEQQHPASSATTAQSTNHQTQHADTSFTQPSLSSQSSQSLGQTASIQQPFSQQQTQQSQSHLSALQSQPTSFGSYQQQGSYPSQSTAIDQQTLQGFSSNSYRPHSPSQQPAHSQLLSNIHDIVDVIDKVKSVSQTDFTQLQPHLVQWSMTHLQDPAFSEQLQLTTKQQDILKLLIKKSLKLNMSGL
jgi:archaellum component FlaC